MARPNLRWPFLLTLLSVLLSALLATCAATDTMNPGDKLRDGESLISAGSSFKLGFFAPSSSSRFRYLGIWYNSISQQTVIWVANRDRGVNDSTGVLSFHSNGSLVLSNARGEVYWSTEAAAPGVASPVARLLDSANFVVTGLAGSGAPAWQSFDYPTDSLMPGMKLGWDLRSGRNRNITSWRSADDPAPGQYSMGMDVRGDPQIFLVQGATKLWRTGPWIGQRFSGIPEMKTYDMFTFTFHNGTDEVYYRFDTVNNTILSRLVAQPTGVVERVVWIEGTKSWNRFWFAPKDQCDNVSPCGPFGICNTNDSPVCSCVQGFEPRSPQDWYLRDGRDGCARRTALDCRNGTDGFVQVTGAKLPDTSVAVVNHTMGLDECRAACLRNCSCTAYSNAEITEAGGTGCINWGGDLTDLRVYTSKGMDLFVRLAAADLETAASRAHRRRVAAGAVVGAVLGTLLLGWIGWCLWRRKRKTNTVVLGATTATMSSHRREESSRGNDELELPLFDFATIAAATDDFSAGNKLGEGGFGPVYMGQLGDGKEVAVKRLAKNSVQGLDEFKNELVLIAKLQHRNLVRLLGGCIEGDERMLIYEYMPNKSLDAFLFDKTKGSLLDWKSRYQIINGIARGLLYLHQDSRLRIIHRDLKASNILLDKEMNPKISDFGMARIFGGDETEANTRRVVGTYGYMSPEYAMDGVFSVKSDVFSFGVLVLEIVSGKRNRGIYLSDPNLNLLGYAWSLWKEGSGLELVDSSMTDSYPAAEVLKCIKVGLLCVQERPEDRPTMASVALLLASDTASLPQPKQPGFVATRGPFEGFSSSSKGESCTVNDVTVTIFDGRDSMKTPGIRRWRLLLGVLAALLSISAAQDTMNPGDSVGDRDSLVSVNRSFKLGFFTPSSSSRFRYLGIWYNTISQQTVVWVANRARGINDSTGVLSFNSNGSLVLSDARGEVYWSTGAATGVANPVAKLLDNANFVVTPSGDGAPAWQSFDYPTDSLLPGMRLGWDLRAGRNHNITAWRSADDPAPGELAMGFDMRGDPQIFVVRGSTPVWRAGPWNGQRFTGIPEMKTYNMFSLRFYSGPDAVYYWFDTLNSSVLSRVVMQSSGVVQRQVWMEGSGTWNAFWFAPKDPCDNVSPCGPFGVCDTNNSPMCSCLQGFYPRSPEDWYLRDGREGCVRRTELDCRNGTDGFVQVTGAKLPDTSAAVVNYTGGLEECRAACRGNCSCTAYASANVTGGGSGCVLWFGNLTDLRVFANGGQDLFVRLAAADLGSSSRRARRMRVAAAAVAAAVVGLLLLGCAGWCVCRRKSRKTRTVLGLGAAGGVSSPRNEETRRGNEDLELPLFDFSTIAAATDDFSAKNKLGEGGFGPVFMGRMGDGKEVAVKRLARNSVQGVDEFKNEVVLIAKLQHRNLVRLLGCCIQWQERMLVYEYMPNRSLDAFLFDKTKGPLLDWKKRHQIINGIARGLLYLHQDSRFRIIHRDLKASNILLDEDMNPKISDFGMARIFGGDDNEVNTKRVVGTYGYMSPEYAMDGVFSVKSDVFSFGVLVLEIVSGKKNRGIYLSDPNLNLLGYAWSLWREGGGLELVDPSMEHNFPMAEVLKCIKIGLLCVQERPEDRPTMASVVLMLGSDTASLPQPKQPGFVAMRGPFGGFSSSSKGDSCTVNDVTVTIFEGSTSGVGKLFAMDEPTVSTQLAPSVEYSMHACLESSQEQIGDDPEIKVFKEIIEDYYDQTGQIVNFKKSKLEIGPTVDDKIAKSIESTLKMRNDNTIGRYLGVRVSHIKPTDKACEDVLKIMETKLKRRKGRLLSMAARVVLVKHVLAAIDKLREAHVEKIERICRDFIWKGNQETKGLCLVGWETLKLLQEVGGFGITDIMDRNSAMMLKPVNRLCTGQINFWTKMARVK
ncbi:hypothetical protein Taro_001515, partial [Colocasia esculenta]|nr:hypothetical protein [Colocasia esculenta]